MTHKIELKYKEAKSVRMTITDNGSPLNVSDATMQFVVKKKKSDTSYKIDKAETDMNLSNAAIGIVLIPLSQADLALPEGTYVGEFKVQIDASRIDKSDDIEFVMIKSVIT